MLIDDVDFDINEFKQTFKKKFDNFCKKAPLLLKYFLKDDSVDIFSHTYENQSRKLVNYSFDYNYNVKENIKFIKDILVKDYYPVLLQEEIVYEDYTPEELNQMVSEGQVSLNNIESVKKEIKKDTNWRIERVIVLRDEIFIRNLDSHQMYRYRMKVPVTVFLKKCRINFTPEEAWVYFESKSFLLNEINEDYSEFSNKE